MRRATVFALSALLTPALADATTTQSAFYRVLANGGALDARDRMDVVTPGNGPVMEDAAVSLNAPIAQIDASIDRFGNVGQSAAFFGDGELVSEVTAVNDEVSNPFNGRTRVTQLVIIDGGLLQLLAPEGTQISFELNVESSLVNSFTFGLGLDFTMDFDFGLASVEHRPTLTSTTGFGPPLNTRLTQPPSTPLNELVIEPTVVEFDLGIAGPLEVFQLLYTSRFTITTTGTVEFAGFDYADPASLVFQPPTFTPLDAPVPLPPAAALLLSGLVALGAVASPKGRTE